MKYLSLTILSATLVLTACKKKGCTDMDALNYSSEAEKDDGSCTFYAVPTTYSFQDASGNNTVSYSGQTERLDQLEEMTTYMKSGTSSAISSQQLKDMFYNVNNNGNGHFSFTSSKKLSDKCFSLDTAMFTGWMDSLANASVDYSQTASNGQAGTLTSGTSTYLFNDKGIEYTQLIEKGLMGAVFVYQATQIYFGDDKMNVDNTTAEDPANNEYFTAMEHHWDEAFGYFGAPVNFPTNVTDIRFWAKYCNSRNSELGCNATMMNAFLAGRTAIINNEITDRNSQIQTIRKTWEKFCAAQAIAYLDGAIDNFGTDNAKFLHELSEAYAFIHDLSYFPLETRVISNTTISNLKTTIGDNFWNTTLVNLNSAKSTLKTTYNL